MEAAVLSPIGSGKVDPPIPCIAESLAARGFAVDWIGAVAWLCVCVFLVLVAAIHQKNSDFYPIKTPFFALFYVFLCH
ncbi:hypothetical protein QL374_005261 [Salmonella enterica]|nr:hypothetical protein [Salmonella enterica]ELW6564798.1 hypothetical protein [Salmonella enterica]ELZ1405708.1 hypothetical protein [Salmonella enterica]